MSKQIPKTKQKNRGTEVALKASKYTEQLFLSVSSLEADY